MLLVVLAPLMAIVALAVWSLLGRPIIYRQMRPGRNETIFVTYKFRTMLEARGECPHPDDDGARLTACGRFLRRLSLDELPQLINVLRGDLSFVGPRPLLVDYLPLYSPQQRRRHEVRPGLTGLAQVRGRNALSWQERLHLDVVYVDQLSAWLDLQIIAATFMVVVRGTGVTAEGSATVSRFGGNDR